MATQNRLMLKMQLENQAQWKAKQRLEGERMAAEREQTAADQDQLATKRPKPNTVGSGRNIYTIVDPIRFCGSAKEVDQSLDALRSNLNSRGHLLPHGGPDYIKYAMSLLDAWSNHQNPKLGQMAMTDPVGIGRWLFCGFQPMPTGLRGHFRTNG